jgi:single-stranded-DNA-specific exonuclease
MQTFSKQWILSQPIPAEVEGSLGQFPPVFRQVLFNRGCITADDAQQYLNAAPPPGTDPMSMLGVPEAVDRICWAIEKGEPIAIYGDYDVDGVTATALLTQALRFLGAGVQGYIPNRFEEGYGLNNEALDALYAGGARLAITVDCGIRSIPEIEHARQIGLDLIISDHHHPNRELPPAFAIINPKQPGDLYVEKNLAGVGLAYKLVSALMQRLAPRLSTPFQPEDYLDLVALGTVADMVPLTGENRSLVRAGLGCIQKPRRQGLSSLIAATGFRDRPITSSDVGFILGPRLNAAGRIESAMAALNLLLSQDVSEVGRLVQQLEIHNQERQSITREIQEQAELMALDGQTEPLLLVAVHESFNKGVIGLAASRLVDRYYRPAIVAYQDERFTRASCRSIPEFHITDALDQCGDLLEHHGGHAAAAGFTVRNENLPELLERLQACAREKLADQTLRPKLKADSEIPLSDLKPELLNYLKWLEPTGNGNGPAVFISRNLRVKNSRAVGREGSHLKLTVTDGRIYYDAIAFRQGGLKDSLPATIDLLYTFEKNDFNGYSSLQLNVKDIHPSGA